ncbi:MAG: hypothetical protein HYU66_23025, partial [Armatimonadetes bacterium]|nr:hypothetical protein [Armatimonadota bacterium]
MIYGTPPDPFWTALNGTVISQYQGLTASPLEDLVLRSPTRAKGVIDRAFGDLSMPDEWVDEITITGFKQYSRNILLGRFGIGIEIDSFDLD